MIFAVSKGLNGSSSQFLFGILIGSTATAITGFFLVALLLPGFLTNGGSENALPRASEGKGSAGILENFPAEGLPGDNASHTQLLPHPHHTFFEDPFTVETAPLHMSSLCGTWQEDYIQLHRTLRAENVATGKERFLVFRHCIHDVTSCGGLGDHLAGIVSSFLLAVIFQRAFLIEWPELEAEAFSPAGIDWRMTSDLKLSPTSGVASAACGKMGLKWENGKAADVNFLNMDSLRENGGPAFECLQQLETAGTVVALGNRGITYWATQDKGRWGQRVHQLGLRPEYAYGCILRFLFRPLPELAHLVGQQLQQLSAPDAFSICIHARPGKDDSEMTNRTVNVKALLRASAPLTRCAQALGGYWSVPPQRVIWYVMSSNRELRAAIKRNFNRNKVQVLTTELEPLHIAHSKEGALRNVVAEWLLCSRCNLFTSHNSGLSRSAALFAMKPMSMFVFSRLPMKQKPCRREARNVASGETCDPSTPTNLEELAHSWSGV